MTDREIPLPVVLVVDLAWIYSVPCQVWHSTGQGVVSMKTSLYMRRVMRDSLRMYFAPLTGAFKGISAELLRVDREIQRHRDAETVEREKANKKA